MGTKWKNLIYDVMEEWLVDPRTIANELICWISKDDAQEIAETYGYDTLM